jgi:type II restriction enzyme
MYNEWFLRFAPVAFRDTRVKTTGQVEETLKKTENLTNISVPLLRKEPDVLPVLRMSTCPPLAVDRLVGLSGVSKNLVSAMEDGKLPSRMLLEPLLSDLGKIANICQRMADPDIFVWLSRLSPPSEAEVHRAATIVADRLCGSMANPIIRNAQETRQLAMIGSWLEARHYVPLTPGFRFDQMPPGTFSFRLNVPVRAEGSETGYRIPVDAVVKPITATLEDLPIMIEAKSAGDFTNTNKRRKEEAFKITQLRTTYGKNVKFVLFLCGYFDSGYLGYEAAEGIDWVWEHRVDDLAAFGI